MGTGEAEGNCAQGDTLLSALRYRPIDIQMAQFGPGAEVWLLCRLVPFDNGMSHMRVPEP